jgi:hypothetical protein
MYGVLEAVKLEFSAAEQNRGKNSLLACIIPDVTNKNAIIAANEYCSSIRRRCPFCMGVSGFIPIYANTHS